MFPVCLGTTLPPLEGRPSRAGTTPSHLLQPLPWRHLQGTCHPSRTRACLSKAQGPPTTRTVRACLTAIPPQHEPVPVPAPTSWGHSHGYIMTLLTN